MTIVLQEQEVTQALVFVNEQISFHERRAEKYADNERRRKMHLDTAAKFSALAKTITDLRAAAQQGQPVPKPVSGQQLSLCLEDVQGLPPELLAELSISTSDWQEFDIITLINDAGGILTLDKILISLFKKTGEIHKRTVVNNRINRMMGKGLLFGVPNRKGVYSTAELSDEQSEKLNNNPGGSAT